MASGGRSRRRRSPGRAGPCDGPKDTERKLHPLLIRWDDLDEAQREKDREPMRALPQMLAGVGFELYRMNRAQARAIERAAM